jgi:hypothetical protein
MNATILSVLVFASVFGAALVGMLLQRILPKHHLGADTKDTVKLAMGLVATMAALVLGLLVASAKSTYDAESSGITQMAAKVIFLDRMLANFGPETKEAREQLRHVVENVTNRMWPDKVESAQLDPSAVRSENIYGSIQQLSPKNDMQTTLKSQAISQAFELGQMRWLEFEQANQAISKPMLVILTLWLSILFVSFGLFSPSNSTVVAALLLAALSVAGAVYLILELNTPFGGLMQISDAPFRNALTHLGN